MRRALAAALAALAVGLAAVPAVSAAEIEARLARRTIGAGESAALEVVVRGASGAIPEPDLGLPAGLEVLGSARSQNFSWINGRASSETVLRYELGAAEPGTYRIGPIVVEVGGRTYQSGTVELVVTAGAPRIGGASGGGRAASLVADVSPSSPVVGQPVVLRVRLIQRASLAEDPQYLPPATPGFWSERFTEPESYYAEEAGQRVLVTETRARLYPLSAGVDTIGEAVASVVLAGASPDPLSWLGPLPTRRELTIRSDRLPVRIRALPSGAPEGFAGAVGRFEVTWAADRDRTSSDVPVDLRLTVRGSGNLPLLQTPAFSTPELELFAATLEDSLGAPGSHGRGRRTFHWTALPRREGSLVVHPPRFVWFDPEASAYNVAELPAIALEVGPPLFPGEGGREAFPAVFGEHPADPGARRAVPLAWAIAGLALGAAVVMARDSARAPAAAAEHARQREWLRAVGLARGPDFWRAAAEATRWLGEQGTPIDPLQRDIEAARFGGAAGSEERVRRRLVEALGAKLPAAVSPWPARVAALSLVAAAVTLCLLFGPHPGEAEWRAASLAADQQARAGEVAAARETWVAQWGAGTRPAGLAARIAWSEAREGRTGHAALWVMRGAVQDARDPALGWVAERVREGGGLAGSALGGLPIRQLEWAVAALLAGAAIGWAWPRRVPVAGLGLVVLIAACAPPFMQWREGRRADAVVLNETELPEAGVTLTAGQVVEVRARETARVRVSAGRDLEGWVPSSAIEEVGGSR